MAHTSSLLVTDAGHLSVAEVDTCDLEIRREYEVIPTVVCSIGLLFGLIYCFLGYRCLKMVMFVSGFMFGCSAVFLVYYKETLLNTYLGTNTKTLISLCMGVLCGLVSMLVCTLGLFLIGLQLGCLLTLAHFLVVGQFYSLTPAWVPLSVLLATSVLCALLTLQWQKILTVLSTSVFGAVVAMMCVDHLVEMSLIAGHLCGILSQVDPRPMCWFSWAIAGVCPALGLTGVLVQWKLTARGVSHTEVTVSKWQKQAQLLRIRKTEARKRPEGAFRLHKPAPLQRYTGDVLAPSYIQSLRERQMGTGSSFSSISTITHTLINLDFETGSLVPLTASASSPIFRI